MADSETFPRILPTVLAQARALGAAPDRAHVNAHTWNGWLLVWPELPAFMLENGVKVVVTPRAKPGTIYFSESEGDGEA